MRQFQRNDLGLWTALLAALAGVLHELNVLLMNVVLTHVHLLK